MCRSCRSPLITRPRRSCDPPNALRHRPSSIIVGSGPSVVRKSSSFRRRPATGTMPNRRMALTDTIAPSQICGRSGVANAVTRPGQTEVGASTRPSSASTNSPGNRPKRFPSAIENGSTTTIRSACGNGSGLRKAASTTCSNAVAPPTVRATTRMVRATKARLRHRTEAARRRPSSPNGRRFRSSSTSHDERTGPGLGRRSGVGDLARQCRPVRDLAASSLDRFLRCAACPEHGIVNVLELRRNLVDNGSRNGGAAVCRTDVLTDVGAPVSHGVAMPGGSGPRGRGLRTRSSSLAVARRVLNGPQP